MPPVLGLQAGVYTATVTGQEESQVAYNRRYYCYSNESHIGKDAPNHNFCIHERDFGCCPSVQVLLATSPAQKPSEILVHPGLSGREGVAANEGTG